ncbi:MAG TPA: SGNH/GDSL hydrolase family protein [Bryobacteraceae bacterium]|nr:SGNH/GDSL hydrolase family protein [Bryobacteraceae bacterium]
MRHAKRQHVLLALCLLVTSQAMFAQSGVNERWVGTWSTPEVGRPQIPPPPPPAFPPFQTNQCPPAPPAAPTFMHFNNQTLRQIVHTSIGGSRIRVVLSNVYGTSPLTIGAAHIALRDRDSSILMESDRPLTFSGKPTVAIPANAMLYSDPVNLTVPQMSDLAIDLYLPGNTNTAAPVTMHNGAFQTNYVSETGNHVGTVKLPAVATVQNWFFMYRVEVQAPESVGGLVAFGDSITDGTRSTPNANNRWPDQLARRMLSDTNHVEMGVMNAAIAGNRVLSEGTFQVGVNALARFEHNALSQTGVTHIIVMEGINDIGNALTNPTPTAEDVIVGYKQLIDQAHSKKLKIYGATLTPFYGAAYYSDVGEAKRQAVNQWIRTSKVFDAVIDFDAATRDQNDPKKLRAVFDSCDHLHPNDAGYKAMADAIDLSLFKAPQASARTAR